MPDPHQPSNVKTILEYFLDEARWADMQKVRSVDALYGNMCALADGMSHCRMDTMPR
jgi:hypothetical protein